MNWNKIKYFSPNENWGDVSMIKDELIYELDNLRKFLNMPIYVLCGTQGSHCANSFHYKGLAVDVGIEKRENIVDVCFNALRFNFFGVGIYTHWNFKDVPVWGLHLDMRQMDKEWTGKHRALWFSVEREKYIELSLTNIRRAGLI